MFSKLPKASQKILATFEKQHDAKNFNKSHNLVTQVMLKSILTHMDYVSLSYQCNNNLSCHVSLKF